MRRRREQLALTAAALLVAVGFFAVPSWQGALQDVCHHATIAGVVTIAVFVATRRFGARGIAFERGWSAFFLAGMPLVYVVAWLAAGGAGTGPGRLAIELGGMPLFGGLAWLGLRRSSWWLVVGISAHGLAWDAWHHVVGSGYIPGWYVTGCFLADLGIGAYLATRVLAWEQAARPGRQRAGTAPIGASR